MAYALDRLVVATDEQLAALLEEPSPEMLATDLAEIFQRIRPVRKEGSGLYYLQSLVDPSTVMISGEVRVTDEEAKGLVLDQTLPVLYAQHSRGYAWSLDGIFHTPLVGPVSRSILAFEPVGPENNWEVASQPSAVMQTKRYLGAVRLYRAA